MAQSRVTLEEFVDSQPLSRAQILIALLCFVAVLLDGFDSILIGYIAPAIKAEWHLAPQQLGPLFGSGVIGLMAGAMLIGPLADRFGRKTILIASVASFGAFTLGAALAGSLPTIVTLRFLAGLGLGATMPCAITLTSEFCPSRYRSLMVTTMFCGFTAGAAISGLVAAWIVSDFGWRAVFAAGGVLPVLSLPALLLALPESLRFLSLRPDAKPRIAKIAARLFPAADIDTVDLATQADRRRHFPVTDLLAHDVRAGTALIWIVYFANLLVLLFLNSWLPTLLINHGMSMMRASAFTSTFQIGGAIGSIGIGWVMDRFSPCRVLAASFGIGVLALLAAAYSGSYASVVPFVLLPLMFAIGVGTGGAQTGAHVVTSSFYRTSSRATGMSWALGIGRIGSVVGSMAGGYLLGAHWSASAMLVLMAAVLLVAALGAALLAPLTRHTALAGASEDPAHRNGTPLVAGAGHGD